MGLFKDVLKDDLGYPGRGAIDRYLAESLPGTDKKPEAVPHFDRLVKEFDRSQYLVQAQKSSKR